jgi:hypothetical protein
MDTSANGHVQHYLDNAEDALRRAVENAANSHLRNLYVEVADAWLRLAAFAQTKAHGNPDLAP